MSSLLAERAAAPTALSFEHFGYAYPESATPAISEISLTVTPGEFVLICGASGSGKSTFLRAACGLVPHHFGGEATGEASICGRDLRDHGAGELAAVCGTVFQDPETQTVMGEVRAEIAFPLENLGRSSAEIAIAVEETAATLGIVHLLGRQTRELSGGELQRVVLAAALAARPELIVLDEPTSQLDPVAADELLATLHRLNADRGTTVVLADHRLERAIEIADRVIVFDGGRVAIDAPPREFLPLAAGDRRLEWLLPPAAELFNRAARDPLPVTLKQARIALRTEPAPPPAHFPPPGPGGKTVVAMRSVSFGYKGAAGLALDAVDFELGAGESAVLMGANGSGKSTLLRLARGLREPLHGRVETAGEVALLLQNPNDYLIHERVEQETTPAMLERFELTPMAARDPRDLSGGERQRLALAIVMAANPAALLLDEPTRGMDVVHKRRLAELLRGLAADGLGVLVATHDAEFAALFAERAVLLGGGRLLADGSAREVLGGGWHFATATANLLPGSGALTPAEGARLIGRGRAG